ncbi:MAG: nuclear transport factor 2 family protein [Acidobacteriota bacterium]
MRYTYATLLLLCVCSPAPSVHAQTPAGQGVIKELDTFLTAWHRAAAEADEELYFGSLAPDAVFLGTDSTERWVKPEFENWAMPYFQRPSAWVFYAESRHIFLSDDGNTAWFDELLHSESYWTCRGSGVLTRMAQGWKIRQYNLAFTIPNEVTNEIKPIVEKALDKTSPLSENGR